MVPRHWQALLRVTLGHARGHPAQSLLLLLGVSLGVAVGIAIDAANGSAFAAFELSTEAVTGRATHRVLGGPAGLTDDVYRRVRVDGGVRASAPVVVGAIVVAELEGETLTLLGVDPFAEPPFRNFLTSVSDATGSAGDAGKAVAPLMSEPGAVVISAQACGTRGCGRWGYAAGRHRFDRGDGPRRWASCAR